MYGVLCLPLHNDQSATLSPGGSGALASNNQESFAYQLPFSPIKATMNGRFACITT